MSAVVLGFALVAACSSGDYGNSLAPQASVAPESASAGVPTRAAATDAATTRTPAATTKAGAAAAARAAAAGSAGHGAPVTWADGYPNINVDTARRPTGLARSSAEQDKLEAELLALGARNRSSGEGSSVSVIQELQELGRRSKADAERQIESGALPTTP